MTRKVLLAIVGLLGVTMAAPSFAADLPRKAPAYYPAPYFSWSGFYVGINGGYGWATSDWSSAVTTGSPKPKGAVLGGTLGYNLQTGVWVWGLEADLDYSWMKATDVGTGACAAPGCETKNTYLATGRGRIGYSFDRWLPYITGGAALGGVKMTPASGVSTTKDKFGWTIGGGVEYAFGGAWSVKAEYLYVDLGKATCGGGTCGIDTDVKFKDNLVRAGLNYRF